MSKHRKNKWKYTDMDSEEIEKTPEEEIEANSDTETENNQEKVEAEEREKKKNDGETGDNLNKELEEAKQTIEEQRDKYLRLSAEFDNYRKRTLKEKTELMLNGSENMIKAILPVIDDIERALDHMQKTEELKPAYEGVELIYNKFLKILEQQGVKKIETAVKAFNTDFYEAIAMIPAPSENQKGKILDCVQTGYTLNDKVIRHAKVAVGQ